jgi:prolyl oligopeptidase
MAQPRTWTGLTFRRNRRVGGRIVAQYLADVQSRIALGGLDGSSQCEVTLPGAGTVGGIGGREDEPEIWYSFSSPLAPSTVYRYDPASKQSTAFEPPTPPVDVAQFETKAMFATSKDGTRTRAVLSDGEEGAAARR